MAFADTEWAVYDGYGVTMEYPSTWTLYCYAESASAANYSVLMVSTAEDIFLRCYVTESDPLPVTILSPSDNAEAKLFCEYVKETAFRAVDFPIMDPAAAMEGDEAVIEFMTALEEYNSDPKNPLPEYTGELPRGQSGATDTVQLSDDGTLASVQDADTGLYGYIDKTGAWRIEPQFKSAYGFSDGRAMVQLEDGSWAYIDRTGALAIPEVRDSDGSTYPLKSSGKFREGIAAVEIDTGNGYDKIYIDLNGLKKVNDEQGHRAGDELIVRAAGTIAGIFAEDAYRVGGDEFVVILLDVSREEFARKTEQLRRQMQENSVDASIGDCADVCNSTG